MKYLDLIKKYWYLFILTGIILFVIYLYSLPVPPPPVTEIPKPTPILTTLITSLPEINSDIIPPTQIIWKLAALNIPPTLPVILISPHPNDLKIYTKVANSFGVLAEPTKLPDLPVYNFISKDYSASYYVNLKDRIAKYSLNLEIASLPTAGTRVTSDVLQKQLIDFLTPLINMPENFSLTTDTIEYQTIDGERFVSTTQSQASFVQITLNYEYNRLPIKYRGIPPIVAKYSIFGPLISVSYALPPSGIEPSPEYSLKSFEYIKQAPASEYEAVSITGNRDFTLSDQDEIIKTTTVSSGYLGYLLSPDNSVMAPYIFLTGTSLSKTYGTLTVTLATPALNLP